MFYTLHKSDNGESVAVKKGDRIVIALDEPIETNKWIWVSNPALTLVDESKKREGLNTEVRVFRFGVNDAVTDVTFNLEDPFHAGIPPVDTFKFSITLK